MSQENLDKNPLFDLAVKYVNQTNCSLFITGRAGTGKTTFLKYIVQNSLKKSVIVAPTGVAAINASGVTIHSLFQLPFGLFLKEHDLRNANSEVEINNRITLIQKSRIASSKRKLLQEIDLLIVDEVSMVKADMFDAIDVILRYVRKRPDEPFGGVQLLCIGDLFQLPPVVKQNEWEILKEHYNSPYFFDSHAIKEIELLKIEFEKIYRQSNKNYIALLNRIRENRIEYEDLEELNQDYYKPDFKPEDGLSYITLCSHNNSADNINQQELASLPGNEHFFEAEIEDNFAENLFPTSKLLTLKEGAQIMFIKNDTGNDRKFYNGKLATVDSIANGEIFVKFEDSEEAFKVPKVEWENIRYSFNEQSRKIDEKKLGSFKQYPIKLAWAVTIHKSQGLTFERAIIDAEKSFSEGQVYVALSRLTGPEGLVLKTPIYNNSVRSSEQVVEFMRETATEYELIDRLPDFQKEYLHKVIIDNFDFAKLETLFTDYLHSLNDFKVPDRVLTDRAARKWFAQITELSKVSSKFHTSLINNILPACESDKYKHLTERVKSASDYFIKELDEQISFSISKFKSDIKGKKPTKKFATTLQNLETEVELKKILLKNTFAMVNSMSKDENIQNVLDNYFNNVDLSAEELSEKTPLKSTKAKKGDSAKTSLEMFNSGKTIDEIAKERALAKTTIEGHLAGFVLTGEISPFLLLDKDSVMELVKFYRENPEMISSEVKQNFGDRFSYNDLKIASNYWKYLLTLKGE